MRASRTWRVGGALTGGLLMAAAACASAIAAAGTITHYPIPVETTPYGITTGPDGKIWFVDSGNHKGGASVGRMATDGSISSADVVPLPSPVLSYTGTPGPDGNMWVLQGSQLDKVPVGVALTSEITPYTAAGFAGGGSIISGPDGRLWFGSGTKVGAATTAGAITTYETNFTTAVSAVIVGPEGKLWYSEEHGIARMDTSGKTGVADEFPLPAGEGYINGMVLGPDGNIWFSLGLPAAIGRITPTGTMTIFQTPTLNSLPFGLAVGPDKQIWFVERSGDAVGVIPTTATSGADIVEYPVGFSNTGLEYITAGPDSRMWFNEFNRSALGAITTNVAPNGPAPGRTPPVPSPSPLPAFPSLPAPAGCAANKLILTDVFPQGGNTQVLGVAPASAAGKSVTIISTWNGKAVARAKVRSDLSFTATVALPPRSLRFTNRANYLAKLGSSRSGALKFSRRMYTTSVTAAGRSITFSGNVTRPFAKRIEPVTIRVAASCTATTAAPVVAQVSLTSIGNFSATFQLPPSLQNASKVYLLAQTRVRQNTHSSKTFPTSTLIRGVKLTP